MNDFTPASPSTSRSAVSRAPDTSNRNATVPARGHQRENLSISEANTVQFTLRSKARALGNGSQYSNQLLDSTEFVFKTILSLGQIMFGASVSTSIKWGAEVNDL